MTNPAVLIAVSQPLASAVREAVTKAGAAPEIIDQPSKVVQELQDGAYSAAVIQAPRGWSEKAAAQIQAVVAATKGAPVLLLVDQADFRSVRDALRCGVADALAVPDELGDLPTILRRHLDDFSRASQQSRGAHPQGRVYAVYSAKGGSGRTLLAANMAIALAGAAHWRVALLDLNLQFGGVEGVLNLKPERSCIDLIPVLHELGDVHLRNVATLHPSGVSVFCAPARLTAPQLFGYEQTKLFIQGLRTSFDQIVVDCSSALFPATEAVLKMADQILYILTPDSLALRHLKVITEQWQEAGTVDRSRVRLVLNRASANSEIESRDITEITGLPIAGQVRANFASIQPLLNVGAPLINQERAATESPIVRDIKNLALRLART